MEEEFTPLILLHALAAAYALVVGPVQLLRRRRGDPGHRALGWSWVAAIAVVVATSFGIRTIDGGFTWLHALSVLTAVSTTAAVIAARRHDTISHAVSMIGTYLGLLGAFVGVVAVPDRRIPRMATGEPLEFAIWAGAVLVVSAALAASLVRLGRRPVGRASASSTSKEG